MQIRDIGPRLDHTYKVTLLMTASFRRALIPYLRRFVRLISLPYCYLFLVCWKECPVSKIRVFFDLNYIFFVLKTYPFHYSLCRLWEVDRSAWKYYYGSNYEPYQRALLSREVQPRMYSIVFDDKEVCYQLCRTQGFPLPDQPAVIRPLEDYRGTINEILAVHPEVVLIIKPVLGSGGHDIRLAYIENVEIVVSNKGDVCPLSDFNLPSRSVVQKYLKQHPSLEKFSTCFSTIRVVTLLTYDGKVLILGAFIRFGVGKSYVDNLSSGGIAVGVEVLTGTLKEYAYDFGSRKYLRHPDTQSVFLGFGIPNWPEVVELAVKIPHAFPYYKLLGLDIGVTQDGPVLIEINPSHDNIALEQSFGPILADRLVRKEFRKYHLLVTDQFSD